MPFSVDLTGMPLDRFFIDRTEVTNKAYKEFVDTGGYSSPEFWEEEFKKDGTIIPWVEAMKSFVDQTGHPGPSTWEMGDYPEGHDEYPVSGVSWYEAAAYAEFRGKSLPTIYHWSRAAYPIREVVGPITPFIISQSNIGGKGPSKVGSYPGIGSSGTGDMAGNVREWCLNAFGEKRYCLGGMWKDPSYMFNESFSPSAWDRLPGNGFRCAVYPEGTKVPDTFFEEIQLGFHDPYSIPPTSKEAFETFKYMFSYEKTPLNPVLESEEKGRGWKRETVTIDAAYNNERLILHLDLPISGKPPYKAVIYFPGGSGWYQPEFTRNPAVEPWGDAIPKSGRAFISPIYSDMFERGARNPARLQKRWIDRFSEWVKDLGRTTDYLETRDDIDTENIAYLGMSWGGKGFGRLWGMNR